MDRLTASPQLYKWGCGVTGWRIVYRDHGDPVIVNGCWLMQVESKTNHGGDLVLVRCDDPTFRER